MKICYFGDYDPNYSRHKILLKGLKQNKAEVIEINIDARQNKLKKYFDIFRKINEVKRRCDYILIAYSNRRFVWFVKLLTRKPLIWDPFYSLYDNWVFDRKITKPGTLKARYYWFLDWICCHAADLILMDTNAQCDWFSREFNLKKNKLTRTLVGADTSFMFPRERKKENKIFTALFYGTYIPVQGADVLVRAAKLLENEDILIIMLGQGQEFKKVKKLYDEMNLGNIKFIPKVPFAELPEHIAEADICLGLLSDFTRAMRSIPNKIYEAVAMGKPCINADTPAAREIFQDKESIVLFKPGDPADLAEKIKYLKNNPDLRIEIGKNALQAFRKNALPEMIGEKLINDIKKINK